jgi:YHS domain-containing protein
VAQFHPPVFQNNFRDFARSPLPNYKKMKTPMTVNTLTLLAALLTAPFAASADDKNATPSKPYPLDTCIVSGEKLDADASMKTYTFVHEGQEIRLCCKGCLKDFKKEPAKYLKKLEKPADGKDKK